MKKTKKSPKGIPKQFHTSNSKVGRGDSYGVGIKNPTGKSKSIMGFTDINKKSLGKPPKTLA